jgi:hypothetical protein
MRASPSTSAVLPTPGLADVERVVLAAPAQDLDRALDLELAPDQGVDAPFVGQPVEVGRVLLEGRAAFAIALAFGLRRVLAARIALFRRLGQPVRDVVDDIEPRDVLQPQQVGGVRMLLAEDRDQHVRDGYFLLAARLDVEHGALQHALEAERGLDFAVVVLLEARRRLVDEFLELLAQARAVGTTGAQDLADLRCIDDGEQQVLDRHEFVTRLTGGLEGFVQADL